MSVENRRISNILPCPLSALLVPLRSSAQHSLTRLAWARHKQLGLGFLGLGRSWHLLLLLCLLSRLSTLFDIIRRSLMTPVKFWILAWRKMICCFISSWDEIMEEISPLTTTSTLLKVEADCVTLARMSCAHSQFVPFACGWLWSLIGRPHPLHPIGTWRT